MNKESLPYRRIDKAILNAFIKISPRIPFEKMTVQDIIEEALVSRYTFYAHFHDKYEVAERIQDDMYQQFLILAEKRIPSIEAQPLASSMHHSAIDRELIDFVRQNEAEMRAIRDIHTETINFTKKLKNYLAKRYLSSNEERPSLELEARMYSAGITALIEYPSNDNIAFSNLSQNIFEANVRVMAYTIGLHNPKDVEKLLTTVEKMLYR